MSEIKTPETHPDSIVIGWNFVSHDGKHFYCDSYDPSCGYWMTGLDTDVRRNVSERAIARTYHRISEVGNSQFGQQARTFWSKQPAWTVIRSGASTGYGFFLVWSTTIIGDDDEVVIQEKTMEAAQEAAEKLNAVRSFLGTGLNDVPVSDFAKVFAAYDKLVASGDIKDE
jgi:hypothetical protein